jgi:transcriptional regulator with PAS, ATPase and Fis domain
MVAAGLARAPVIRSAPMVALMSQLERFASSEASVLITGESGTGKELIARAVHDLSQRAGSPFIDVSCAALPESLVESELFGYERGAFSGALTRKAGYFELAHRGSLFLDEIGELDTRVQVKLLRVLDGMPYFRLGGTQKVATNVRIIAATNQDLTAMSGRGTFRKELYHRLAQIHIAVPPLRERVDDIVPLAEHFLMQERPALRLDEGAWPALWAYEWPGNIRELRNVMLSCAALCHGDSVSLESLPAHIRDGRADGVAEENLDRLEQEMILKALAKTNGSRQQAAALLGISRRTLSRKIKIYGFNASWAA